MAGRNEPAQARSSGSRIPGGRPSIRRFAATQGEGWGVALLSMGVVALLSMGAKESSRRSGEAFALVGVKEGFVGLVASPRSGQNNPHPE